MSQKNQTPHAHLALRIMHLKSEKYTQEQEIKRSVEEIMYHLNPINLAKESLHSFADDPEVQVSATQSALQMGSRFLTFKVLGRFGGVAGVIGAAILGKVSDKFMREKAPMIVHGISSLFKKKSKDPETEDYDQITGV